MNAVNNVLINNWLLALCGVTAKIAVLRVCGRYLQQQVKPVLQKLKTDSDFDVQYYAVESLEGNLLAIHRTTLMSVSIVDLYGA